MTKPLVKNFLGGSVTAIAVGDTYKDPTTNQVVVYEQSKVQIHLTKVKAPLTFTKEAWDGMIFAFNDPEIQKHLKRDWE
jgi:hypothetical protein